MNFSDLFMKKFLIFIVLILVCISLFILYHMNFVSQKIFLSYYSEKAAVKVLAEYLQGDSAFTELNPENMYAFEFDLNDDGVNEVLGYVDEKYYCINECCTFFVLQKQSDKYVNIAMMRVDFHAKMTVKRTKLNGFDELIFDFPDGNYTVKYQNGWYRYIRVRI